MSLVSRTSLLAFQAELATSHKRLSYEVQRLNTENEGLRGVLPQDPCPSDEEKRSLPGTVQVMLNCLFLGVGGGWILQEDRWPRF